MKKILEAVEHYGFSVEKIKSHDKEIYICNNELSQNSFVLDCNWHMTNTLLTDEEIIQLGFNNNEPIVHLLNVSGNHDKITELFENQEQQNTLFLVYDQSEELEFFMKDLWNLIILISNIK